MPGKPRNAVQAAGCRTSRWMLGKPRNAVQVTRYRTGRGMLGKRRNAGQAVGCRASHWLPDRSRFNRQAIGSWQIICGRQKCHEMPKIYNFAQPVHLEVPAAISVERNSKKSILRTGRRRASEDRIRTSSIFSDFESWWRSWEAIEVKDEAMRTTNFLSERVDCSHKTVSSRT